MMPERPFTHGASRPPRRVLSLFVVLVLVTLAAGVSCRRAGGDGESSPLAAAETLLGAPAVELDLPTWLQQHGGSPPLGFPARSGGEIAELVQSFYQKRQQQPAWFADGRLRPEARQLVDLLGQLEDEALAPSDYRPAELAARMASVGEGEVAPGQAEELEVGLTWAALLAASHIHHGRLRPEEVGTQWRIEREEVDLVAVLEEALGNGQLPETLRRLGPDHPQFVGLLAALRRYQGIGAAGGWPEVPKGPVLKVGDRGDAQRLRALAVRLHAEGFLPAIPPEFAGPATGAAAATVAPAADRQGDRPGSPPAEVQYSPVLAEAVKRFQRTRTLHVDGNLGPATQEELNVPVAGRLRQLSLNVERWRWVPDHFGDRAVLVNIPGYTLDLEERRRVVDSMAVVVGDEGWETPVFSDRIEYVEVNPFWNVPPSILREEIIPALQRNPGYLASQDMEVVRGQTDDASRVSDGLVYAAAEGGDLRVRQRPGPKNPLGQIKFMFPNAHNVYLHDTPADHLFKEPDRAGSHGCIRVERPYDLGAWLLGSGWSAERVRSEIAAGARRTISLPQEVPVYLLYFTAAVRPDGTLEMYEDVYGVDAAHARARAALSS
jgi:murein L,D-transpeptidase YcbB/YkuD